MDGASRIVLVALFVVLITSRVRLIRTTIRPALERGHWWPALRTAASTSVWVGLMALAWFLLS